MSELCILVISGYIFMSTFSDYVPSVKFEITNSIPAPGDNRRNMSQGMGRTCY